MPSFSTLPLSLRAVTLAAALLVCGIVALACGLPASAQADGTPAGQVPPPTTRVTSVEQLEAVLRDPSTTGRVVVPADADWPMTRQCGARDEFGNCHDTPLWDIPIHSGVELVGERGPLGSRPILRAPFKDARALFVIDNNDVRVEGLHFQGPQNGNHAAAQPYSVAVRVIQDPVLKLGRRIDIADNEFDEWGGMGVHVVGMVDEANPADYHGPAFQSFAGHVRIEHNYFHHNAPDGGGYGVVVSSGAYAAIIGNVFDFNRHAVSSNGRAFTGYVARFNYVLQGGYTYGSNGYYGQAFDVHGTGGGRLHIGGRAGEYYEVAFNTIRGEQSYGFLGLNRRPAFELRGKPAKEARFANNVVVHDSFYAAIRLKGGDVLNPFTSFNLRTSGNHFDTDYSTELATGDFDGDGRSDVFVATGTGWFYSRAGIRPWQFLRASNKRVRDLGFADITNDGVTDVLYRDSSGTLGYVDGGADAPLTPLTTTPVAIGDLHFGDFDGDALTDIFYTLNGQWQVWYGSTRTWTPTETSVTRSSDLRFGEFDDVRGTDVIAVRNGVWSISSASTHSWAKLNDKLVSSFSNAVAADFDGNGRTDLAFSDGETWRISRDGRAPLATLRTGSDAKPYGPLTQLLVDRFDGGTRAQVISFESRPDSDSPALPLFLVIWRGSENGDDFIERSEQNMR